MKVFYYSFNTKLGKFKAAFTNEGIVKLSLPTEKEKDFFDWLKRYFNDLKEYRGDNKEIDWKINRYLEGKIKKIDIPIKLYGTDFQKRVWRELLKIPYGEVRTYKYIAEAINKTKGYRAVGNANNKNPIPIIVPCHRVIGTNKRLIGYGGGLDLKAKLLRLEGVKFSDKIISK
ncbi:methylated-DNA--[protein]-cysteine S-methyltransferase [Thermohalobacter berrensis]|uniref:Methylated-DNA--protein-cysteine methyltransferase n=1 Tax=Thermohalobacter berrensis TaxID=99594 RepID=A0A419SV43_9FIRM|nr:methylated-DNA--[protein]-cysteine S-methyltransferase [Thermohalobacter berrensis]RKD29083.1 hypothetical protein BET03_05920 [Thermohalobacter berrensis]